MESITLIELRTLIREEITLANAPILIKLDVLTDRVDLLTTRVDGLTTRVDGLTDRVDGLTTEVRHLSHAHQRQVAIHTNSLLSRNEALREVPNEDGILPSSRAPHLDFPPSLSHLLVAGNERIPGTAVSNVWNKTKSKNLLAFYGALDGYDSETDNEHSETARILRLKVAKTLGAGQTQLQMASMALADF